MQNRKSARKCRMKKKEEFSVIKDEVVSLRNENKQLKDKVSFGYSLQDDIIPPRITSYILPLIVYNSDHTLFMLSIGERNNCHAL